ncbi:MAG: LruC domain-containing protein [Parabacteroides sp.]
MKKTFCWVLLAVMVSLAACTDDQEISAIKRTEISFADLIGGEFSSMQWWRTAVQLKVTVKTQVPTSVSAYAIGEEEGTLYDYKSVTQDSLFYMTVPQSANRTVVLMAKDGTHVVTGELYLTGSVQQSVEIDMLKQIIDTGSSALRASQGDIRAGASLYGTDILPNIGYTEVDRKGIEIVTQYTKEGMDVERLGLKDNYELISQGPFEVTMYYGFTGMQKPRILGYYRHSPGTYQDLEFVDMVDTHTLDYINGKAKLQYQLDGETDIWYDANFDYRDGYEAPFTTVTERLDDDAYNIQLVMDRYGSRLTKARGLTWRIDVKPGDRVGFYLKATGKINNAQRENNVKRGLPSSKLPDPMYEMNWSAKTLNTDGKHRSVVIQDGGYTIMGMEDADTSGDFDCNDVLFGLHAEMESEMPIIVNPDIDALLLSLQSYVWTIAYEDMWRDTDFDFNDAVIRLKPDYENEVCSVTVMAAGSTSKMYLHYEGPDGDQNLGEIHELFGRKTDSKVNTTSTYPPIPFVELGSVKWSKEYTMTEDAKRFYIVVQRGTCEDCGDLLTLPYEPGLLPQAILVAGSWNWPKEGTPISEAYRSFSPWAMDMTNTSFWDWYISPQPNTYVDSQQ